MLILISGTREGVNKIIIKTMIDYVIKTYPNQHYTLIHGNANGVDKQCANYVKTLGWTIKPMSAEWDKYGKRAGILRNQDMVNYQPDFGVFIPSITSIGTYDCLRRYELLNKPGIVYEPLKNSFYTF